LAGLRPTTGDPALENDLKQLQFFLKKVKKIRLIFSKM